jgi:protoporphyrinogen oxidase
LGAAHRLHEANGAAPDWILVEATRDIGGLAATVQDHAGYRWDLGGHVIYSHYELFDRVVREAVAPDRWTTLVREGWVWHHDRFVPAPFQRNLHRLDPDEIARCVNGLRRRSPSSAPTFDAWLLHHFGDGLADLFFRPFNFKMWGYPATSLCTEWTGLPSGSANANVPLVDLDAILKGLESGRDAPGWDATQTFPFPEGGTGTIWEAVARRLPRERVLMGQRAVAVDPGSRVIHLANGERIAFEAAVSSLPLDVLLSLVVGRADLRSRRHALVRSSTWLVGMGFDDLLPDVLGTKRWMYFPDRAIPFHRATVLSNYSREMLPDPRRGWSLLCEVAESPARPVGGSRIVPEVVRSAAELVATWGGGSVKHVWSTRIEHGYPTPFLGREAILAGIHPELEASGILSRGRFGGWRYEVSNQDHCFMQGWEAVGRVLHGERETTFAPPRGVGPAADDNEGQA